MQDSYLSVTLDWSVDGSVKMSMQKYIDDVMEEYNVTGQAVTPAEENLFNITDVAEKLGDQDRESFHSCVAKLLFLAKRVRLDILTAISFLTTRVQSPDTDDDKRKLGRVLKYLNKSRTLVMVWN